MCTQYETLREPAKLDTYNKSDICRRCQEEHANAVFVSPETAWMREVGDAINRAFVGRSDVAGASKGSLWDLLELNRHNGGRGYQSDFGKALTQMDAKTLCNLRGWLDDNREEVADRYGDSAWLGFRTIVGFSAYVEQLPSEVRRENFFAGLPDDGLPMRGVAMRVDGKKWDLNIPVRAELLPLAPRYFSQEGYAKALGIGRHYFRDIRARIRQEGFTLDGFTLDALERIVRGDKRGRKEKK